MKIKELQFKCDCGCNSQVLIQIHPESFIQIDCRDDGRHKWHGVVLWDNKMKKLKEFILKGGEE